jgi:hypothetical protein
MVLRGQKETPFFLDGRAQVSDLPISVAGRVPAPRVH